MGKQRTPLPSVRPSSAKWPLKSSCHKRLGAAASNLLNGSGVGVSRSISPPRRKMPVIVLAAGIDAAAVPRHSDWRIFRPPQTGFACLMSRTAASTASAVRRGDTFGRRERSSSPSDPSAPKRFSHL